MSTISSSTTSTTAYKVTADTTGTLVIQTGATPTTAVTVGTDQSVALAGNLTVTGTTTTTGYINVPNTFGFKNRIINGAMVIDQRNAGASVTPTANGYYSCDRWQVQLSQASKFSIQQNAGSVTSPTGFTKYLGITSLSSYSVGSGDYFNTRTQIEGFNTTDLGWGTASASAVTLSFWVRSSLTGTFGGALGNGGGTRGYAFTYTISSANTWEQKTITVAGDTTGTWATDNSSGIIVYFGLGVGSTYSGSAGSWAGAQYMSATGATSVVGTNGATFYITGVQLEKGSTATSFDYRPYGTELALCQRYFQRNFQGTWGATFTATDGLLTLHTAVAMRANPTLSQASGVNIVIDVIGASQNASSQSISGTGQSPTKTPIQISGLTGRGTYQPIGIANDGTQLSAEL